MMEDGLMTCLWQGWRPEIGDPEVTGWITVAIYLISFALALTVWRRHPEMTGRGFWGVLAVALLFLAVNKQLDLQSALTQIGRCLSQSQGWYDNRRPVQFAVIGAILVMLGIGVVVTIRSLQHAMRPNALAITGLILLAGFVMVRAVGFHFVDLLIGQRLFGISANFVMENSGLILISLNALILLRREGARAAETG